MGARELALRGPNLCLSFKCAEGSPVSPVLQFLRHGSCSWCRHTLSFEAIGAGLLVKVMLQEFRSLKREVHAPLSVKFLMTVTASINLLFEAKQLSRQRYFPLYTLLFGATIVLHLLTPTIT